MIFPAMTAALNETSKHKPPRRASDFYTSEFVL